MGSKDALDIDISQRENGVVVSLKGAASMEQCDHLNEALYAACESKPQGLVIEMSQLRFICSLGLGGLVAAYLRVQKHGGTLMLAAPGEAIREMLEVTKLGTLLPVYDSAEEALASL